MALMFRRLARNYAKAGYFPTDDGTVEQVVRVLRPSKGLMRILDPTAGEGAALADVAQHLGARAYGIEYEVSRATAAKSVLQVCLHADVQDCRLEALAFGLLWLNPPYGDTAADSRQTGDREEKRLEHLIYRRTAHALQFGGVLVLIIPRYALTPAFSTTLARNYADLAVLPAAVDTYQQLVLMGIRQRSAQAGFQPVRDHLVAIGRGEAEPSPWESLADGHYTVPVVTQTAEPVLMSTRIDRPQLAAEIGRHGGLWPQAESLLGAAAHLRRPRPLRTPSPWHLALMLAAGQITGIVESSDGRRWIVKGDTRKERVRREEVEQDGDRIVEVVTLTDRFVPSITAIDLTPGPGLGSVIHIQ